MAEEFIEINGIVFKRYPKSGDRDIPYYSSDVVAKMLGIPVFIDYFNYDEEKWGAVKGHTTEIRTFPNLFGAALWVDAHHYYTAEAAVGVL